MLIRHDGRVAIVTGAGRGLGRSYALELARRGAAVVVNDAGFNLRGDDGVQAGPADQVVAEIAAAGGRAIADYGDITDPVQAKALVDRALGAFGQLDIVVNNAGNNRRNTFANTTLDDLRAVLDVHVVGTFNVTQAAWPHLVARNYGRIVLTTSQVGFYGKVDSAAYGTAKAAVIGLMHNLRIGGGAHGITANCVSPFAITRMGDVFPQEIAAQIDPSQVAAAVAWLTAEACTLSGEIVIAGAGHFAVARTVESRGIDLTDPAGVTAEALAESWPRLADLDRPLLYDDALTAIGVTFDAVKKRAGL